MQCHRPPPRRSAGSGYVGAGRTPRRAPGHRAPVWLPARPARPCALPPLTGPCTSARPACRSTARARSRPCARRRCRRSGRAPVAPPARCLRGPAPGCHGSNHARNDATLHIGTARQRGTPRGRPGWHPQQAAPHPPRHAAAYQPVRGRAPRRGSGQRNRCARIETCTSFTHVAIREAPVRNESVTSSSRRWHINAAAPCGVPVAHGEAGDATRRVPGATPRAPQRLRRTARARSHPGTPPRCASRS
jgi:hypothetical protein